MGHEIRKYDCALDINNDDFERDEFDFDVYEELMDLCTDHHHIVLVLKLSKYKFSFNLLNFALNVDNEGSDIDYMIMQEYFSECENKGYMSFPQMMARLIEGVSMTRSPIVAYFCDTEAEANKIYDSIKVFKKKADADKEKKAKMTNNYELIYVPHGDYHPHQFINFCKKYNLDPELKEYKMRSTTIERPDRKIYVKDAFLSLNLLDLDDFLSEIPTSQDIIEAKYGQAHIFIYRFTPEKYSKLVLLKK